MKVTLRTVSCLSLAFFLSACTSQPYYVPKAALSKLGDTTIVFDSSKYEGINLIVTNDLDSDVFLRLGPQQDFLTEPVDTKQPFRVPDMDERYRKYEGTGRYPTKYTETFMFIWAGNTGFFHVFRPNLSPGKDYYLPITYYHCKEGGFYTKSVRITEANKITRANHGQR